jgi:hypothetical protein
MVSDWEGLPVVL